MSDVSVDVKDALDTFMSTFEEFKEANDQRLDEIEAKGSADVLLDEKLDRINESLDLMEDMNQRITAAAEDAKAQGEQLDAIETAVKRVGKGPAEEAEEKPAALSLAADDLRRAAGPIGASADPMQLKLIDETIAAVQSELKRHRVAGTPD